MTRLLCWLFGHCWTVPWEAWGGRYQEFPLQCKRCGMLEAEFAGKGGGK